MLSTLNMNYIMIKNIYISIVNTNTNTFTKDYYNDTCGTLIYFRFHLMNQHLLLHIRRSRPRQILLHSPLLQPNCDQTFNHSSYY